MAQIDLEQVAGHDLCRKLPPAGLLSFFYDSEQSIWGFDPADRGGWQVVFTPPGTPLVRMDFAPELPNYAMFDCRALRRQPELTYSPWESFGVNQLRLSREELVADHAVFLGAADDRL
ncbi:MAG: DUF1963 domain-containing protein [Chloroflexi bacterium]|nr:DUF1963 domain-containing protein [Chloroflexota bacterium]